MSTARLWRSVLWSGTAFAVVGCGELLGIDPDGLLPRGADADAGGAGGMGASTGGMGASTGGIGANAGGMDAGVTGGGREAGDDGSYGGSDAAPPDTGAECQGAAIAPPQELKPPTEDVATIRMGADVALEENTAIVTASDDQGIGRAYVLKRGALGAWNIVQTLTPEVGAPTATHFDKVAMSGNWALIGAYAGWDNGLPGDAYFFRRIAETWTFTQKVQAPQPTANEQFGRAVAIFGDTAVIDAPEESSSFWGDGSVYVYRLDAQGRWNFSQQLTAPDGEVGDLLGLTLSLGADDLVACAPFDNDLGANSGSAYLFERVDGTWSFHEKLTASAADATNHFFCSSASLDGDTLFIGAEGGWGGRGQVYAYTRQPSGEWVAQPLLPPSEAGVPTGDAHSFGWRLAVSGDVAVVGMRGPIAGTGADIGSAYLYRKCDGFWTFDQRFDSGTRTSDFFTGSIDLDGSTAVVGAMLFETRGASFFYDVP